MDSCGDGVESLVSQVWSEWVMGSENCLWPILKEVSLEGEQDRARDGGGAIFEDEVSCSLCVCWGDTQHGEKPAWEEKASEALTGEREPGSLWSLMWG